MSLPDSSACIKELSASIALDGATGKSACPRTDNQTRRAWRVPRTAAPDLAAEQATDNAPENGAGRTR